jgi:hypothetical protein
MNEMNLEIWFPQPDVVTVSLASSAVDEELSLELSAVDEERMCETMLFALFAARQIANLKKGGTGASLGEVLFSVDQHHPLPDVEARLGGVRVESPGVRGGGKGFTAELRPDKRGFFKAFPHGFGLLGRGLDYYGPTSVLALLSWLLKRRQDDDEYQGALGFTAKGVGAAGGTGQITVMSQVQVAMTAAGGAWMQPPDLLIA